MNNNYNSISKAVGYIIKHVNQQPSLNNIAADIDLSPHYFNRLFDQWAGISPQRFLERVAGDQAEKMLDNSSSVFNACYRRGASAVDPLISIDAMTPGEYRTGDKGLSVVYGIHQTPFGRALIAITDRGITKLDFIDDDDHRQAVRNLGDYWRAADIKRSDNKTSAIIKDIFNRNTGVYKPLSLYVKGTDFQLEVWRTLLSVRPGRVCSYKQLAKMIGKPDAYRAVGGALGANPVAYLIPCHRVILASGEVGAYRWGNIRKRAILCREEC